MKGWEGEGRGREFICRVKIQADIEKSILALIRGTSRSKIQTIPITKEKGAVSSRIQEGELKDLEMIVREDEVEGEVSGNS